MTKITHIDHIAIVTANLKESLDFYENKLGIKCTHTEEMPERGIKVAMLPIGETRIELIEPLHENSEVSAFLKKKGPGLHHIALGTKNMSADFKSLTEQGVKMTSTKPMPGAHKTLVGFIHPKSASGVLTELVSKV